MNYPSEKLDRIQKLYETCMAMTQETSHTNIKKNSFYSQHINSFIYSIKELQIYQQFNLKEQVVTRPSLVMDIDPSYCTPTGETNAERMAQGKAPYDPATGSVIDLHHIGQRPDSPFAELPHCAHNRPGITGVLHRVRAPSWRKDTTLVNDYMKETTVYWKQRGEVA